MPVSLQLALVLSCRLQQVPQMLSAVTQAMPELQGGRGVHHVPCSSGQGGTQVVYSHSKISTCGKQAAGVRGDGNTPRSPPSTGLGSAEAVHADQRAKEFPEVPWQKTGAGVFAQLGWFWDMLFGIRSPQPRSPAAGSDACVM